MFRWRDDDGPTLRSGFGRSDFQGIWTSIAKTPYIFVIFRGVWTPCPPPLDPRMWVDMSSQVQVKWYENIIMRPKV